MRTITLTESEVAYIEHLLSEFWMEKNIRTVMRLLVSHFPVEGGKRDAVRGLSSNTTLEKNKTTNV